MSFRRFALTAIAFTALSGQAAFAQEAADSTPPAPAAHGHHHHCRDGKGKFTKCNKKHHHHCRDGKGKFTKCDKAAANDDTAAPADNKPMNSDMQAVPANAPAPTPAAPAPAAPTAPAGR